MASLVIVVSAVLVLSCRADKQMHRHTQKWTNAVLFYLIALYRLIPLLCNVTYGRTYLPTIICSYPTHLHGVQSTLDCISDFSFSSVFYCSYFFVIFFSFPCCCWSCSLLRTVSTGMVNAGKPSRHAVVKVRGAQPPATVWASCCWWKSVILCIKCAKFPTHRRLRPLSPPAWRGYFNHCRHVSSQVSHKHDGIIINFYNTISLIIKNITVLLSARLPSEGKFPRPPLSTRCGSWKTGSEN